MLQRKKIFVIIGSASQNSSNQKLVDYLAALTHDHLELTIYNTLKALPHFDPRLSEDNPPLEIIAFRKEIEKADGILICTPEYVFSIPSGLKNAIEWCVSTTVFSDKPVGLITASAGGEKGHDELQLLMKTLMTRFTKETTLLISGIKGKVDAQGCITDPSVKGKLSEFAEAFKRLVQTMPVLSGEFLHAPEF